MLYEAKVLSICPFSYIYSIPEGGFYLLTPHVTRPVSSLEEASG